MWMTPHTLVGVTIANQIENPALSLPLAFLSHYVFDFIPHWTQSPKFKGKESLALYLDFLIAFSLGLFFAFQEPVFSPKFWTIIIAAALANLPDALRIPRLLIKKTIKLEEINKKNLFHLLDHFHSLVDQDLSPKNGTFFKFLKGKLWFGILTQALTVAVCLFFLLKS